MHRLRNAFDLVDICDLDQEQRAPKGILKVLNSREFWKSSIKKQSILSWRIHLDYSLGEDMCALVSKYLD